VCYMWPSYVEDDAQDIEFIMEPTNRSLDLRCVARTSLVSSSFSSLRRPNRPPPRPTTTTPQKGLTTILCPFPDVNVISQRLAPGPQPSPSLTTEYTPRERGAPAKPPAAQPPPASAPVSKPLATPTITVPPTAPVSSALDGNSSAEDGPDPSKFPPVAAPPSHPAIDPTATGMLEGRPVFEVDMAALADKAWRRPGSDISDWFNYGFDEISWEAYCYRRRELGDLAAVLKTNVVVRTSLYRNIL